MALGFSPRTELLAAGFGFSSGIIQLWDSTSGEPRGQLTNHTGWVSALAFTPDGNHLLVGESIHNAVHDWNLATGECNRQELPHTPSMASATGVRQISVSPDGKQMAISLNDYSLTVWTQDAHFEGLPGVRCRASKITHRRE